MRRIIADGGMPRVVELDPPICTPGRVVVETEVSTVSTGTETAILNRSADPSAPDLEYPGEPPYQRPPIRRWMSHSPEPTAPLPAGLSLGYSLSGRVVEVGDDVPDIRVGDLVACAGSQDAHHAEIVSVSRSLVAPVPDGVQPDEAAFVTLGGVRSRPSDVPTANSESLS